MKWMLLALYVWWAIVLIPVFDSVVPKTDKKDGASVHIAALAWPITLPLFLNVILDPGHKEP